MHLKRRRKSLFLAMKIREIHPPVASLMAIFLLLLPLTSADGPPPPASAPSPGQNGLNYISSGGQQQQPQPGQGGQGSQGGLDLWQTERPADMANIKDLEVMCGKQHMEVTLTFDRPFNGIVFSKGAIDRYDCIYVKPQTGQSKYKFDILYDSCGSKPDLNGKFYENNIVIQYDKDLIEVWDEAKRLRCEWYNDYEKGVTKPPIRVSDIEVVELNFRGDNVDCWMEIQQGKGPWASPVNGIVPLGTTLTMVVGIDDKQGEFDMRVKSCEASDNQNRPILLSDENGCVLRPKMISKFLKIASSDPRATVVTYAFFHAFKFPDSLAVQIRCKVEICRFGCPDHCQSPASYISREQEVTGTINSYGSPQQQQPQSDQSISPQTSSSNPVSLQYPAQSQPQPQYSASPPISPPIPNNPFSQTNKSPSNYEGKRRRDDKPEDKSPVAPVKSPANHPPGKAPPPPQPNLTKDKAPPPPQQPNHLPGKAPPPPQVKQHRKRLATPPVAENQRSGGRYAPAPLHQAGFGQQPLALPLQQQQPPRQPPQARRPPHPPHHNRRMDEEDSRKEEEENKKEPFSGGIANFLGLKLPELPELPKLSLPFFSGNDKEEKEAASKKAEEGQGGDKIRVKSEAIPVSMGKKPASDALEHNNNHSRRPSAVPISRTSSHNEQPLVYPSGFNTAADSPVVPIEKAEGGPFPYGPRALNMDPIEKADSSSRRRRRRSPAEVLRRGTRSADIGVRSGYEVVSEVDLAFTPAESQAGVAVLKGRIQSDEVVYGICLPATGFSALFVLVSLLTVVSILVSGFVCYQRQLQKVAEEDAPVMTSPGLMTSSMAPPPLPQMQMQPQQMGWGFNTWFKKTHGVRPALY